MSVNWLGRLFYAIKIDWYNKNKASYIYINGYIVKALTKYQHINPKWSHSKPYRHSSIQYVFFYKNPVLPPPPPYLSLSNSSNASKMWREDSFFVLLTVDPTLSTTHSSITPWQSKVAKEVEQACHYFIY